MEEGAAADPRAQLAAEHFEVLGRFVQAFEQLVEEVRHGCASFVMVGATDAKQKFRASLVFHHHSMTAGPLSDMLAAFIADHMVHEGSAMSAEEQKAVKEIASQVLSDIGKISRRRNEILHGTWYIGFYPPDNLERREMISQKYLITPKGAIIAELPKTTEEMDLEIKKCKKARRELEVLRTAILHYRLPFARILHQFVYRRHPAGQTGGRWHLRFGETSENMAQNAASKPASS